jgi:Flp pilus assembly protein TadD
MIFIIYLFLWLPLGLALGNTQKTALENTSQTTGSDLELAKRLFQQGSVSEALAALQRFLGRSPNVDGLNLLGMIYYQRDISRSRRKLSRKR